MSIVGKCRTVLLSVCLGWLAVAPGVAERTPPAPRRIVSMAPSATEIVYALGLGDRVVGVTRYCDYPASATAVAKVGGYMDPNYEQIVSLEPDLTILLTSHRDARARLEKLGLPTLTIPHETIADVHTAIRRIADACGREATAEALLGELTSRARAVRRAVAGRHRPRVLVCVGRDTGSGRLAGIYVAGRDGFYDEILELAGGTNACRNERIPYPQVSAEGIVAMNPDIIVDLIGVVEAEGQTPQAIAQQWQQLRTVEAVRRGLVHVVVGREALRPGPRYLLFLEKLAEILHPAAFEGTGQD